LFATSTVNLIKQPIQRGIKSQTSLIAVIKRGPFVVQIKVWLLIPLSWIPINKLVYTYPYCLLMWFAF